MRSLSRVTEIGVQLSAFEVGRWRWNTGPEQSALPLIGAGATVICDVPEGVIAVGTPAIVLRTREALA